MTSDEQRGSGDTPIAPGTPDTRQSGYGQPPSGDQRTPPFFSAHGQGQEQTGASGYPPPTGAAWGSSAYGSGSQPQGYPDEIQFRPADGETAVADVLAGQADVVTFVPPSVKNAGQAHPALVHTVDTYNTDFAYLNSRAYCDRL